MFGKEKEKEKKEKHLYPCYMKNTLFVLILLVTDEKQRMKDKAIASCMYISWIWKGKKKLARLPCVWQGSSNWYLNVYPLY